MYFQSKSRVSDDWMRIEEGKRGAKGDSKFYLHNWIKSDVIYLKGWRLSRIYWDESRLKFVGKAIQFCFSLLSVRYL